MPRYNIHQAEIIRTGLDHPEGINFGSDGRLYAGGNQGQLYVMSPPKFELNQITQTRGVILGVALDKKHRIYACNPTQHCILRFDQGNESVYCNKLSNGLVGVPNYGCFDGSGNYYFSDTGDYWKPSGQLIRVKPGGTAESLIGGNWHASNGIAISPRDGSIFMIESTAADILRIPIAKDGTAGQPEIYAQLPGTVPDGLAFAANGNLYCSCYRPNRIYVISPDQNVEMLIEDSTGEILNQPTNIAFEPNGTRLFYANLGGAHVGAFEVSDKGAPLSYPDI
jgi:sugar lactone lactonase YvrE